MEVKISPLRIFEVVSVVAMLLIYAVPFLPMLVDVEAATSVSLKIYDFKELADESGDVVKWWTGDRDTNRYFEITFGGPDTDPDGFAMYKNNVGLNDGNTYAKVLETHPKWVPKGEIIANYYNIYIPQGGGELHAKVGFIRGGTAGDAYVYLYLVDEGHNYYFLVGSATAGDHITYSGGVKTYSVKVPDVLKGETCVFGLRVYAGDSSAQDWVAWPEIYLSGKFAMNVDVEDVVIEVIQGGSESTTVHIAGDYPMPVDLSVTGLPAGVSASFNPTSHTPPFDAVLTISASETAATGTFNVQVKAEHGSYIQDTKTITLEVKPRAQPDFVINVSPPSITINKGEKATYSVGISPSGGFSSSVSLHVSGLPAATSYEFNPASGIPPFPSSLTIQTSDETPTGTYELVISGTGGGKSHSATVDLIVKEAPDFHIGVEPSSASILQGESASFTVEITGVGGFDEEVSLSVPGLPHGAGAVFADPSGVPNFSTTLTIEISGDTPPGIYEIEVRGIGGGKSHSARITLEVAPPPDFAISLSQLSVTLTQGGSTALVVSVERLGSFSDLVRLSVPGLPPKVYASFTVNNVVPPFTSTLMITTEADAMPGTWNLVVEGTGGGLTKTANLRLIIEKAPQPFDFQLTVSQASLTLKPNQKSTVVIMATLVSGEPEEVTLSVVGLPPSISYSITPSIITPTGSATLEITAGAEPGAYSFVIQGQGGGKLKTQAMSLTVEGARCLIATAAFGSELAAPVQVLREYRDDFVMKTFAGSSFMMTFNAFYYSWSPSVARAEYENPALRSFVRALIYPLIYLLDLSRIIAQPFSAIPELAVLISGVFASLLIGMVYVSPISSIVAFASRWRGGKLKKRYIFSALPFCLTIFFAAEVLPIPALMMTASSLTVLSCVAIGAISLPTAFQYILYKRGKN